MIYRQNFQRIRLRTHFPISRLHVLPHRMAAVREMAAVTQPGGVLALSMTAVPIYAYLLWERACQTLDPDIRFPGHYDKPEDLQHASQAVNAKNVVVKQISMAWEFADGEEFVSASDLRVRSNNQDPGLLLLGEADVFEWPPWLQSSSRRLERM